MEKQRKQYDKAFKENAVKFSYQSSNASEVSRELGICPTLLRRWRKEYHQKGVQSFTGHGVVGLSPQEKELLELKKKLQDAETERDILKKALSIFSKSGR
ncbi:MAG: transposase [Dehalococcoidales bacterium]|nr:transposase [Dehalococcoidales bacterium]